MITKPNLQWRSQDFGNARNRKHLLRKSAGRRGGSLGRRPLFVTNDWAVGVELPNHVWPIDDPHTSARHQILSFLVWYLPVWVFIVL